VNKSPESYFKDPFNPNTTSNGVLFGSNNNTNGANLFFNTKPQSLFPNQSLFPKSTSSSLFGKFKKNFPP